MFTKKVEIPAPIVLIVAERKDAEEKQEGICVRHYDFGCDEIELAGFSEEQLN